MTAKTTEPAAVGRTRRRRWVGGVVAGLVAGVSMGLVLHFGAGAMALVGALYGRPTVTAGWIAHLINGVVFALVFVAVVSRPLLRDYASSPAELVGLGVGYGAALGVLTGGLLLPLRLDATGAAELSLPHLAVPGLVGEFTFPVVLGVAHLVYGALLGAVYAAVAGAVSEPRTDETVTSW